MLCEPYRQALTELAATGEQPSGGLRAHLSACASCRSTLEGERTRLASIDSGLRSTMNQQVPEGFLPRVRARLAADSAPKRSWQVWAGAAAAIVVAVLLAQSLPRAGKQAAGDQRVSQEPVAITAENRASAPAVTVPRVQGSRQSAVSRAATSTVTSVAATRRPPQRTKSGEPEILVSADEVRATARYLGSIRRHRIPPIEADMDSPALEIDSITIAELTVEPLERAEENSRNK